jgi:ankyrin repeat protein
MHGHRDTLRLLLRHKDILVNAQDKRGRSALVIACQGRGKNAFIVKMMLMNKDLNINTADGRGRTALWYVG